MTLKKGQVIKFNFHCAGVVSQEETTITKIGKDYIQVEHGEPEYKFDKQTGKCLNESSMFGAYRTLPAKYLSKPHNHE